MNEESITCKDDFKQQLETMIRDLVKEKMETLMKSEREAFLGEMQPANANQIRNQNIIKAE